MNESNLGIIDENQENNLDVFYPNPFTNKAFFQINSTTTEPILLKIIDMKGTVCFSSNDFYTNQKINISHYLASGIYTVVAIYGNTQNTFKVIKD